MVWVLVFVVAVAVAFLLLASRQPDEFRITRTAVIDAPAHIVFDHINDLHKWQTWSPWARADPEARTAFAGPDTGIGSSFHWEGKSTGVGTMTITESRPATLVQFRLDFEKPMKATNTAEFTLSPQGDKTHVSWSMFGENKFAGKCMNVVIDCEKIVGKQFDEGLGYLNEVTQKAA